MTKDKDLTLTYHHLDNELEKWYASNPDATGEITDEIKSIMDKYTQEVIEEVMPFYLVAQSHSTPYEEWLANVTVDYLDEYYPNP